MKILPLLLVLFCGKISAQKDVKHFIFFNRDRDRIREISFLENDQLVGAQLKYVWKELEVDYNVYDFSDIEADLDFLTNHDKRLFIQLQDVSFGESTSLVPNYLLEDTIYNGGASQQYELTETDSIIRKDGFVANRWNEHVQLRFIKLLDTLGKTFDGKIEGINLPETSVVFGETGRWYPTGFTPLKYRDAILNQMKALKKSFGQSIAIQYANFMPGEWLPGNDMGYLESIYRYAAENGIGMGGPDIKIYRKAQ
ncbi:MAG: hypothetical protein AAFU67_13670, partial [Bacteroidota bacterium]